MKLNDNKKVIKETKSYEINITINKEYQKISTVNH